MSRIVRKKQGKEVEAWELGENSEIEKQMIEQEKIEFIDGNYYLVSTEIAEARKNFINENKEALSLEELEIKAKELIRGEEAQKGDFFKIDGLGNPYPNEREWFLSNHKEVCGDTYEQIPKALEAYKEGDGVNDAIDFLVENKLLTINKYNPDNHYEAILWGSKESANKDATIVFYGVDRDKEGKVTAVDFNFVEASEFKRTYDVLEAPDKEEKLEL